MRCAALSLATMLLLLAFCPDARANSSADARARLEIGLREVGQARSTWGESGMVDAAPGRSINSDKLERVKHGLWSLVIPGWSQYRSGHTNRALLFGGTEVAIWASYALFQTQGHTRRDAYEQFAQQFAGVQSTDHGDNYWRQVASYRRSEDYNTTVRKELRAGLDPSGPLYTGADTWTWQSEQRFTEYKDLRGDSLAAFDHATFVTVFALVNRVAAFVDAVRTGVDRATDLETEAGGFRFSLKMKPDLQNPRTTLAVARSF